MVDEDLPDFPLVGNTEIPAEWLSSELKGTDEEKSEPDTLGKQLGKVSPSDALDESLEDAFGAEFGFDQILSQGNTKRTADEAFPFTTRPAKRCVTHSNSFIFPYIILLCRKKSDDAIVPLCSDDNVDLKLRLAELEEAVLQAKEYTSYSSLSLTS